MSLTPSECVPTPSTKYEHYRDEPINEFHSPLHFTNFLCDRPSEIAVSVNFTKMHQFFPIIDNRGSFQVIIGHSDDTLTTIRRTKLPVVLLPGMNLLGFAHQHKLRQLRNSGLSAFGLYAVCTRSRLLPVQQVLVFLMLIQPFDEFLMSEITQIQPRPLSNPTFDDTASLVIYWRKDY